MNLAGNAIKFADVGEVTIEVAPCQQAGWIRFSVTDDGPGLSEALIPRLFERFMSPVEPMLLDRRGHGLGLAICKDIIGELGGDIGWSPNIEGLGSKFWFEIPLPESFITLSDTNAALPAKSVLVIDDNPAFRVLLGEMLRAMGHNVIVCGSGASGLAAAHDKHFDVAFVDLMLLDTSGEDVVLALRAVEPGPAIVLMSAADWNIGACRVERRPDAFLAKPFDATELVAVLTTVSSGRNTPD
jgi:CheY-like chemotaxis protein